MQKLCVLTLMITPWLFAQDSASERHCKPVGGAILTNFVDPTDTLGTATGDFKGGLGVHVLSVTSGPNGTTILHNHHHWVTEAGDTILFDNADATLFPTPVSGLYAATYIKGVKIIGGTGRFENARGNLTSAYGAVDLPKGQVILRYEGHVCMTRSAAHSSDSQTQ
ncbi:MAG: hypothetical protein JOY62_09530 [Acidobacteriaceae bacterium]|nr:hypothetical protein [Acidobacteriaceae bacterium]MBV9780201.1 hypothetical protein [Acidobacteriaceae bacterium]